MRAGKDVIVDAPTGGAGKTRIFEILVEDGLKGQAIYTVPTRALAIDKRLAVAEYGGRGIKPWKPSMHKTGFGS